LKQNNKLFYKKVKKKLENYKNKHKADINPKNAVNHQRNQKTINY